MGGGQHITYQNRSWVGGWLDEGWTGKLSRGEGDWMEAGRAGAHVCVCVCVCVCFVRNASRR